MSRRCLLALVLAARCLAGTPTLEIDTARFPVVQVTLDLPAEKMTKDLGLDDIRVVEDGVAARLSKYATLDSTALVLVVERGPGVRAVLPDLRAAAQRMLRALGKGPPAALVVAGDTAERAVALTRNRGKLDAALDALAPEGGVRLAPALRLAVEEISHVAAKTKVILVLSAGRDLDARGRALAEDPELERVLERARRDGVPLRVIPFGADPDRKRLASLAEATGGEVLADPSAQEMERIYGDPIPRVRFSLTYSSPRPTDFAMRGVAVSFRMFGFEGEVVGYYGDQGRPGGAPGPSTGRTAVSSPPASPRLPEADPGVLAEPESGGQSDSGQPRSLTLPQQSAPPSEAP